MVIVGSQLTNLSSSILRIQQFSMASNQVYLLELNDGAKIVFKPSGGERPLWDFPSGQLWLREYLANNFLNQIGIDVPQTQLSKDADLGSGLLIDYLEHEVADVARITTAGVQEIVSWKRVLDGFDENENKITLWHKDDFSLRKIAIADIIINNADRKASHVLMSDGKYVAIDHGLSFHEDEKLRTIFWGWAGERFSDDEIEFLELCLKVWKKLDFDQYISKREYKITLERIERLLDIQGFPVMPQDRNFLPWPIY
jgi:uncharacterized repeat protein (TIGR03843 family)